MKNKLRIANIPNRAWAVLLLSLGIIHDAAANAGGITGRSKARQTCNECHTGGTLNSEIELQAADSALPGEEIEMILTLGHSGQRGGFNMSASGGTLIGGTDNFAFAGELIHSRAQNVSNGQNRWDMRWQAPDAAGEYEVFVCANAVNGDGTVNGDERITACTTQVITVGSSNAAPEASNDSASTDEDNSVTISVLQNDTDSDGSIATSSVNIVSDASNGSTSVNSSGTVTYTPDSNFFGSDSFSYNVQDNEGETSNTATVSITVNSVNDIPVANDDVASTSEDTAVTISILSNDTDVEGDVDQNSIAITSSPSNGDVAISDGRVTYTPGDGFSGTDTFQYTVDDSDGGTSNEASVSITVVSVNDQPVAQADSATTDEDSSVVIDVLSNDSDSDGSLDASSVQISSSASNGSTEVNTSTGAVTYTPDADFNGSDSFQYTVADNEGARSDAVTVSVTVNSVNDAPVASDDSQGTNIDTAVEIAVLENDSDPDGSLDMTSITIEQAPGNGTAVANASGTITYTPNSEFTGEDSFQYSVMDNEGERSNIATVSLFVRVNIAPSANDDAAETNEDTSVVVDVLANDSDDLGLDASSVSVVAGPENGTTQIDASTGAITYSPNSDFNGTDSFTYKVSDFENADSNEATVSVTVESVNDAPVFASEPVTSVTQGQPYSYSLAATDVDTEEVSFEISEGPSWLSLAGSELSGTAPVEAIGDNNVTVIVSDGELTAEQSFVISVLARTDADLSVSISATPVPSLLSESIVYQFDVSNAGPADANNVELNAQFNGDINFDNLLDGCSADSSTLTCTLDTVTADQVSSISVTVNPATNGDIATVATVTFDEENNPDNDTAYFSTSVAGEYVSLNSDNEATASSAVVVADVNDDGFADVLYVMPNGEADILYINTATGQLQAAQNLGDTASGNAGVFADIDGDSDVDLVVANHGGNEVYTNEGGEFTHVGTLGTAMSMDVQAVDLNSDGSVDLVFANAGGANTVYLNDGAGAFEVAANLGDANSHAVAALDMNADGLIDLVFANGSGAMVYINQSGDAESMFATGSAVDSGASMDVTVIDLDLDGQVEVMFANTFANGSAANTVFNVTGGQLSLRANLGAVATKQLSVADVNGDAANDVLFVNEHGGHQVYLSDGADNFTLTEQAYRSANANSAVLADLNGDGDVDVVFADAGTEGVLLNQGGNSFAAAQADLSVAATSDDTLVMSGAEISAVLSVTNTSSSLIAQGTELTITLPEGVDVSTGLEACTLDGSTATCSLGDLSAGDSTSFTIAATVTASTGQLTFGVSATSSTTDPATDNNTASVSISVNQAPVANNDSVSVEENSSVVINVLTNDSDDTGLDSSTVTVVTQPSNGSVSVSGGNITYTPTADFTGSDSFSYTVNDDNGVVSNTATVSISVTEKSESSGGSTNILLILLAMLAIRRIQLNSRKN